MKTSLVENIILEKKSLKQTVAGDVLKIKFPFLRCDEVNGNNRIYPQRIVEKAVARVQAQLAKGASVYGSSNHPDKELTLDDVSHMFENFWLDKKEVWADAKILPTSKGKNLRAIISSGGALGVSARGTGDVNPVEGHDVVQENYTLHAVDFVLVPSFDLHVNQTHVFESADFSGQTLAEADVTELYRNALLAGYRGTKEDYKKFLKRRVK